MQRDRFSRFQPTYPYLQHQIDLPPTISLSDGEEPPPYQGPCTLQLRDPEQQMELNRESVRAPPNRTIYDSDLIDMGGGGSLGGGGGGGAGMGGGGPRPPSSNSGISAANSSSHGRMEGPPPAYSEVMGHYPGSAFFLHQHSNNQRVGRSGGLGSRTIQQQSQSESTIVPAKAKDGQPEDLVWRKGEGGGGAAHPRLRTVSLVHPGPPVSRGHSYHSLSLMSSPHSHAQTNINLSYKKTSKEKPELISFHSHVRNSNSWHCWGRMCALCGHVVFLHFKKEPHC